MNMSVENTNLMSQTFLSQLSLQNNFLQAPLGGSRWEIMNKKQQWSQGGESRKKQTLCLQPGLSFTIPG